MDTLLHASDVVTYLTAPPTNTVTVAGGFNWTNDPDLPSFSNSRNPIQQIISWGQGIIVVIGIIGILFAAGKMAIGKFGRSDLAADGVGGLVWTIMGISLMLVAIPVITTVADVGGGGADAAEEADENMSDSFDVEDGGE